MARNRTGPAYAAAAFFAVALFYGLRTPSWPPATSSSDWIAAGGAERLQPVFSSEQFAIYALSPPERAPGDAG